MTLEPLALADRRSERGQHQFGAQMVGHRPAEFGNQTTDYVALAVRRIVAFPLANFHHALGKFPEQ